jgi:pimeloyl-ACP methyl ester carboxylesterase
MTTIDRQHSTLQRIRVNNHELECQYIDNGAAPTAPVLVLLHEGLGCIALWRQFPQLLCELTGCPVLVYSRAGYGASSPVTLPRPLDYMTREAIDTLPGVLDAVNAKRVILVGHSDGATIAAVNAGSTTDYRVRGVVLIAPHFFTEDKARIAIAETRKLYDSGDLRARLAKYHHNVDVAFYGWCDAWLDEGFIEWNVADCIDHLRVPVLAIQGSADEYGTLAQIEELEQRIYAPLEKTIIPDCGHSPHLDATDATLASMSQFIQRLIAIEQSQ